MEPTIGITLRYAALSQRGYYPEDLFKANQDAFAVLTNFDSRIGDVLFSVFDGHGKDGDACSRYVRDGLDKELRHQLTKQGEAKAMAPEGIGDALTKAFLRLNRELLSQGGFDAEFSGTTAVTALFRGGQLHVGNVGDSRIVIGERRGEHVIAVPLSHDQTPFRRDERQRCKAAGSYIRTGGQLDGETRYSVAWEDALGVDDDENSGDPPRLWARDLRGPGCAFTRSLGDAAGEAIGVFARPELVSKELREQDQFVVLASDGVWEFISSQRVVDMVMGFHNPLEACRAVIAESYRLWLQYDVRTDDITMILAFFDSASLGRAPRRAPDEEVRHYAQLLEAGISLTAVDEADEGISLGLSVVGSGSEELRPVRRALSAEMRAKVEIDSRGNGDADEDLLLRGWSPVAVPKTETELGRIRAAVKANAIFDQLSELQRKQVYSVMRRVEVSGGELVIRQGDVGEDFYIVDEGTYAVTIGPDDASSPEIMTYEPHPNGGANPCFGELALLYSKPRGANVVARSAGVLWALDRRSFRAILSRSSEHALLRTLRHVQIFRSLPTSKLRELASMVVENKFEPGEVVMREGEMDQTFFIIAEGVAIVTKASTDGGPPKLVTELHEGDV